MKYLLLFTAFIAGITGYSQTTHQVCISEVYSTGACNSTSGIFTPGNLTIQQGDMIQFTTHMVLLAGYNGTHDIQFTGSPANNVLLPISTNILAPITTVTTPPFNTPGTFPMECVGESGNHCFIADLLEGWACTGYSVTVVASCGVTADFSASATNICQGTTVNFTNASTGATSYTWKINEVPFATSTDAVQNFGAAGSFDIELIADDGSCQDSMTVTIDVTQAADAGTDESNSFCNIEDSIDLNTMVTGDAGGTWTEITSSGQFNPTTGVFEYTNLSQADYIFEYVILGNSPCPNDTAEMTISVNSEPNVMLNVTNTTLATSDSANIDFTSSGVLPGANWLWSFCDGNFDNLQSQFYYSWDAAGDFCVCVEINNYNGCIEEFCDSSIVVFDDAGIEAELPLTFDIYPNPAEGEFVIDLSSLSGETKIIIFDLAQRVVTEKTVSGGSTVNLNAEDFAKGKYIVQIRNGEKVSTKQLLIH